MSDDPTLLDSCDALLLDLDGVVYVGQHAVPNAAEVIAAAARAGKGSCYVTNNASRTPRDVADHLVALGLPATPGEVLTSAQAGAGLLADQLPAGSTVLAVGGEGVSAALRERGFAVIDAVNRPVGSTGDRVDAVMQGFGRQVGWEALARASFAVASGVPWVATNTDRTIPVEGGLAPGNGTLVDAVAAATGRQPQVAGKPFPAILHSAARRLSAAAPLVVGDRLDTDIQGAAAAGMPSLLVLTGVTRALDLWAAPPKMRPTSISWDLRGVLAPPLLVEEGDSAGGGRVAVCSDARAEISEGALRIGGGDPVAGLWAAAHLVWRSAQPPVNLERAAREADRRLRAAG